MVYFPLDALGTRISVMEKDQQVYPAAGCCPQTSPRNSGPHFNANKTCLCILNVEFFILLKNRL